MFVFKVQLCCLCTAAFTVQKWPAVRLCSSWCWYFYPDPCSMCQGAFQHGHPPGDQRGTSDLRGNPPRLLWRVHRTTPTRKTFKRPSPHVTGRSVSTSTAQDVNLKTSQTPSCILTVSLWFSNQGIVIEFSDDSGLIKCAQNPQLYFHMSEVIEKKKLELNEKVEFSVVPVSPPHPFYPLCPF